VLRLCGHAVVGEVVGCGDGQIALARRLRFWTVATHRNSSFAPVSPRAGAGGSSRGCVSYRQSRFNHLPLAGGDAVALGLREASGKVARGSRGIPHAPTSEYVMSRCRTGAS
jgi:hypothetical protein